MHRAENLMKKYVREHPGCMTIIPNYPEEIEELARKHPDKKIGQPEFESVQAYNAHWAAMREFRRQNNLKLARSADSLAH